MIITLRKKGQRLSLRLKAENDAESKDLASRAVSGASLDPAELMDHFQKLGYQNRKPAEHSPTGSKFWIERTAEAKS